MDHRPHAWAVLNIADTSPQTQQPRDDVYGAYDASYMQTNGPNQHTQSPIVTGTSVVAMKFKDGVVIAADNLGTLPAEPSPLYLSLSAHLRPD
ncbi:hypothetical protein NUW58_g9832 [Xylaria curta]|uniref:Uncharacterized protein n=1 Tax=Xylaria curta TaxID=42375 RepID=A0ACC1MTG0_9PEZI|nr:hypothetical protein NUW58_g9832 [Xylaria curta]